MNQNIETDNNSLILSKLNNNFNFPIIETSSKSLYQGEIEHDFMCFFQSFQLLNNKKIVEAIEILGKSNHRHVNIYLQNFLKNFNYIFADTKPCIDIWSKTNAAKKEYSFICDVVFKSLIDYNITPETLIDIGTGDGFLLNKLLYFFTSLKKDINLILVDKDISLLNETKNKVLNTYPSIKSIQLIHRRIENFDITSLRLNRETTVINAASVLHELKAQDKIEVIRLLKEISNNIFISELESNHDLPENKYLELAYSTFEFYDGLIYDTLNSSQANQDEKIEFINNYLIFELFHILTNKYENRINYHTTQSGWHSIFNSINCEFDSYISRFEEYLPNFFTFHLKS